MLKKIALITLFSISSLYAQVNREEFLKVKEALYKTFEELKSSDSETLSINTLVAGLNETYWWDIEMVHASYVHQDPNDFEEGAIHNIYIMGGFSRFTGMTPDGLLVTGCHEIGHGIGGAPRKNPSLTDFRSSMEGQSDYFATRFCLPIALKYLEELRVVNESDTYKQICDHSDYEERTCLRMLTALEGDVAYFNYNQPTGTPVVNFETFSEHIQNELNFDPSYYPDSQCRLDTMINGILKLERPECWYPGGEVNGLHRD